MIGVPEVRKVVNDCETGECECDCPDGVDDTDAEREAKFKAYGIEPIPVDDEWLNLQRRKRYIRERNAYLATLPPVTEAEAEAERLDSERIIAEWDAEVNKAFHEQAMRPLGIGEWNHDEPCTVPDKHIKGFSEAMRYLGVEWRYNVRSVSAEINHESLGGWRGLDDRLNAESREVWRKGSSTKRKPRPRPCVMDVTHGMTPSTPTYITVRLTPLRST